LFVYLDHRAAHPALSSVVLGFQLVGTVNVTEDLAYSFAICTTVGEPEFKLTLEHVQESLNLLDTMHRHGITHGDPRVRNIVLTSTGLRFVDSDCILIDSTAIVRRDWKILLTSLIYHLDLKGDAKRIDSLVTNILTSENRAAHLAILASDLLQLGSGCVSIPNYVEWISDNSDNPEFVKQDCLCVASSSASAAAASKDDFGAGLIN
jgi:hypothetical protein